jgi:hypothetical protein
MKKYFNLSIIIFCLITDSEGQALQRRTVYKKDFKWTVSIPAGFDTVSADQWTRMQNRGKEAIEKVYDEQIENNAKTIFVFQSDKFNYFESNYQPFDPEKDGDYIETFKNVNALLYGTFVSQMKGAILDSASSTQSISGLSFYTFKVVITFPGKLVMKWQMFSRLFDKKEFTVNILTVDDQKEKDLMDSWLSSKFEK